MDVEQTIQFRDRKLNLSSARIMGILNITPDSFSDGGQLYRDARPLTEQILKQAVRQVNEGASIIDIGGESTRPGAPAVSVREELDRTIPVVELLASRVDVILSIDTCKPEVMLEAARAGVHMINDVRALTADGTLKVAADSGLPVCLMHMQGRPEDMQKNPHYEDVVSEVRNFLEQRVAACVKQGIAPDRLIIDPGFGFGKNLEHNLLLLKHIGTLRTVGQPILVGLSRKSTIGQLIRRPMDQRLQGSVAAAVIAVQGGARIVRTHDVAETADALKICNALMDTD